MNTGTKIRTMLAVATCLNTALMATDLTQFNNDTVNLIYRIVSVILNFVIVACVTWYNNDYTEEGAVGTQITREMKATKNIASEPAAEPEDSYIEEVIHDER